MLKIEYAWSVAEHLYDYSLSTIGIQEGNLIDTAPRLQGSIFFNIFPINNALSSGGSLDLNVLFPILLWHLHHIAIGFIGG